MAAIAAVLMPSRPSQAPNPLRPQPPLVSPMQLHLIFAKARNGVIGKDNALPWHLPEDMAHFKRVDHGLPGHHGAQDLGLAPRAFSPAARARQRGGYPPEGLERKWRSALVTAC